MYICIITFSLLICNVQNQVIKLSTGAVAVNKKKFASNVLESCYEGRVHAANNKALFHNII